MFSTKWQTSPRKYGITIERDVAIPVRDGVALDSDIFRPDAPGKFPALLAVHAYSKAAQSVELMPIGFSYARGFMETGDFNFYVRRGYALLIVNITGTHKSGGIFGNIDPQSIQDVYEAVEWTARQPWCDGNVGMTGVSHFSRVSKRVAALNPPHLRAIFSPYGWTDMYRDLYYHGGIFNHGFMSHWVSSNGPHFHTKNTLKEKWGEARYAQAIEAALADPEISAVPYLVDALSNPDAGANSMLVDIIVNNLCNEFHKERTVNFENSRIPAYFGGDWGLYGLHLPGDIRAIEKWKGPKKLTDRPARVSGPAAVSIRLRIASLVRSLAERHRHGDRGGAPDSTLHRGSQRMEAGERMATPRNQMDPVLPACRRASQRTRILAERRILHVRRFA